MHTRYLLIGSLAITKARFAFRIGFYFLKNKEDYLFKHQNLAGPGPGFDSKSEQLTCNTILTDLRQRTSGPVLIRWLMRSP